MRVHIIIPDPERPADGCVTDADTDEVVQRIERIEVTIDAAKQRVTAHIHTARLPIRNPSSGESIDLAADIQIVEVVSLVIGTSPKGETDA